MNELLELEKRLAELLGYVPRYAHLPDSGEWVHAQSKTLIGYRAWTRDNAAAFALMVEQAVDIYQNSDGSVEAQCNAELLASDGTEYHPFSIQPYADHSDKATAVRVAIVKAVIAKLEGKAGNVTKV